MPLLGTSCFRWWGQVLSTCNVVKVPTQCFPDFVHYLPLFSSISNIQHCLHQCWTICWCFGQYRTMFWTLSNNVLNIVLKFWSRCFPLLPRLDPHLPLPYPHNLQACLQNWNHNPCCCHCCCCCRCPLSLTITTYKLAFKIEITTGKIVHRSNKTNIFKGKALDYFKVKI